MAVNKFQPERTAVQPLSNNVYSELQAAILTGKIKTGHKLTEQQLCRQYEVSRTPVREALRQLETEGLVESVPNKGVFVLGFTKQEIDDMYELRSKYEIQATEWAIKRITRKEFDELEETFEFMEFYTMKKDWGKMVNINSRFHRLIYEAAHNRMLMNMLSSYQLYLRYMQKEPEDPAAYLNEVLEEHRMIFNAFKAKNPDAGSKAMEAHMAHSRERHVLS